jgi:predicted nucleotidyltransferase
VIVAVRRFLTDLTLWASSRDDVLGVALVGSQARGSATASSDVDVVLLVRDPQQYFSDTIWTGVFGNPIRHVVESYGQLTSLRVWYEHGLEVEFGFGDEHWPDDPGGRAVMAEGMKVLLDRALRFRRFECQR